LLAGDGGASSNENGRALITEKLRGRRAPERMRQQVSQIAHDQAAAEKLQRRWYISRNKKESGSFLFVLRSDGPVGEEVRGESSSPTSERARIEDGWGQSGYRYSLSEDEGESLSTCLGLWLLGLKGKAGFLSGLLDFWMVALPAGSLVSGPQLGWRPAVWNMHWLEEAVVEVLLLSAQREGRWTLLRFYASTLLTILPLPLPHC
jgi:hypothetical protein